MGATELMVKPRLGLASAMGAIAVMAVGLFLVRGRFAGTAPTAPPLGDSLLYEEAQASRDLMIRVGQERLAVQAVARNDRDGSLSIEDGRGRAISGAGLELELEDAAVRQSSWLDLAV